MLSVGLGVFCSAVLQAAGWRGLARRQVGHGDIVQGLCGTLL